jgi:hypothetical protein
MSQLWSYDSKSRKRNDRFDLQKKRNYFVAKKGKRTEGRKNTKVNIQVTNQGKILATHATKS